MTGRWPLNRGETLILAGVMVAVLTLVCTALAAIPNWVPFLEDRGYDAARLIPALQWVQRARWVIVALVPCAVAVLLVWRFWGQLVRLFKWLGGLLVRPFKWLAAIGKRFYLWLLWKLVIRWARDYLGVVALGNRTARQLLALDRQTAEALVLSLMPELSDTAVLTLEYALDNRHSGGTVFVNAFALLLGDESDAMQRLAPACEELEAAGLIVQWIAPPTTGGVSLRLNRLLLTTVTASRVKKAILDERSRRFTL